MSRFRAPTNPLRAATRSDYAVHPIQQMTEFLPSDNHERVMPWAFACRVLGREVRRPLGCNANRLFKKLLGDCLGLKDVRQRLLSLEDLRAVAKTWQRHAPTKYKPGIPRQEQADARTAPSCREMGWPKPPAAAVMNERLEVFARMIVAKKRAMTVE